MAAVGYGVNSGSVALSAATARSVVGIRAGATFGVQLKYFDVSFDGVTAAAVPVYIEVCTATFATNGTAGTNNTNTPPTQRYGRLLTHGMSGYSAWTAGNEPTVLVTWTDFWLDPYKGTLVYDYPLGNEPDSALNEGFVIRCTAPATVNVRASLRVERV